jgi:hypothetical protein
MPVYLSYGSSWLKLKEVPEPLQVGRRRKQRRVAPYGLVAETVDSVKLNGLMKVYEVVVPATKVSRFASKLVKSVPHTITVVIEPHGDDYVARFYAPSASYASEVQAITSRLFRELKVSEAAEEAEVEVEAEEEEE